MDTREVIEAIKTRGLEAFGRYYAVYRGYVVTTEDPEKRGRVELVVPGLNTSNKPVWADPMFSVAGKDYGTFVPPHKGDCVWVRFENGDPRYPVYGGGWFAKEELPTEMSDGYVDGTGPTVRGIKTKYGHALLFDDENGKISLFTKDGHELVIDDDAKKTELKMAGGITVTLDEDNKKVVIDSTSDQIVMKEDGIYIGSENASQPLVLGNQFVSQYGSHAHTCGPPGSPSSPPIPAGNVMDMVSKRHKTE